LKTRETFFTDFLKYLKAETSVVLSFFTSAQRKRKKLSAKREHLEHLISSTYKEGRESQHILGRRTQSFTASLFVQTQLALITTNSWSAFVTVKKESIVSPKYS